MIHLTVPPAIEREIKAKAKAAFPREWFCYCLGTVAGDSVHIDELWVPENQERYCTEATVNVQPWWMAEAAEAAKESGLMLVADAHSHGYSYREGRGVVIDRAQSEQDIERAGRLFVAGICTVQQVMRAGRKTLRASLKWWGPNVPVQTKGV